MLRVRGEGRAHLVEALEQLSGEERFEDCSVPELINRLVENGHAPQVQYISGHWMDINNLDDLQRAGDFAHGQNS
jgi:phosphoenolpyruvate phosphomutase